jgi:hypothetical protein
MEERPLCQGEKKGYELRAQGARHRAQGTRKKYQDKWYKEPDVLNR